MKRLALVAVAALAVAALLLRGVLHTGVARNFALRQATTILAREGIVFEASRLDYSLLAASATLDNVVLRSALTPDLPPFVRADRVSANLDLWQLLRGAYRVEQASVLTPRVHVVLAADGRTNIPKLPDRPPSSTRTDFRILSGLLQGGTLRWEDRARQFTADVPLRQVTISGGEGHRVQLESAAAGQLTLHGRSLPLRGLAIDALVRENALLVRNLQLQAGESTLGLSGQVDNFDNPRVDLTGGASLALAGFREFLAIPQPLAGMLQVSLKATGPVSAPLLTGRLAGEDLTLERFPGVALQADARYESGRLRLPSLLVQAPAGTVRGQADIALNAKAGLSTATLRAAKVNLLEATPIASSATGTIEARWPALDIAAATGNVTAELSAIPGVARPGVVAVSGAVRAQLADDLITVALRDVRALATVATGEVVLLHRTGLGGEVTLQSADIAATLRGLDGYLGRKSDPAIIAGPVTAVVTLDGTRTAPALAAQVRGSALKAGQLTGLDLDATLAYRPGAVDISNSILHWRGQKIETSGHVTLGSGEPQLALDLTAPQLALDAISGQRVSGTASIAGTIAGTPGEPSGQFTIEASRIEAYHELWGDLTARVDFAQQVADIREWVLRKPQPGGDGSVRGSGSYALDCRNYRFHAESNGLRLLHLLLPDGREVTGGLGVDIDATGNLSNPSGTLRASATDLRIAGQALGEVTLRVQAADRRATIEAGARKFRLTATGTTGIDAPYPAELHITADNTDLVSLPVEQPFSGVIGGILDLKGNLDSPRDLAARAEIATARLTLRGQPITNEGPLVATYANRRLNIEQATIVASGSRLTLRGGLPGAIQVAANADLARLLPYLPPEDGYLLQGIAQVEGSLRGTLQGIDPDLRIAVRDGYFATAQLSPPIYNAQLEATLGNGALDLTRATFDWGVASFTATGSVPFALLPATLPLATGGRQGPAKFVAELKALDLATIAGLPSQLTGTVGARLEAEASRPEISAIRGTLTFPELTLGAGNYLLRQQDASTVAIANGIARVTRFHLTGPDSELRGSGTAGLAAPYNLDLALAGNLDLAIASAFTDAFRAHGAARMQLALTGPANQPKAQGTVETDDVTLSMDRPRLAIESLNLRARVDGTRLEIAQLGGELNGGTVTGKGALELRAGRLVNTALTLNAQDVYLDFPQGLRTVSHAAIQMRSAGDTLVIGGDVNIVEGGFTDDLNFDTGLLAALTAPRGIPLTEERDPLLERIRFQLGIATANPIVIDNNLAQTEVEADLRLLGTPYEPGMSGRLTIIEGGQLRLQERRYTVERGVITFTADRRIQPSLDILATTAAEGYNIRLQISGEPGKTETILTSDPQLPEPDILALLLTGRKMDELRGQEFDVARNQVLSYLTGRVGSTLGRGIAGATGLSTVRIEPNLIAAETDPSARLTIGQDITRNLEVIYSMDLVNSSDQIYLAEYDVTRRFTTRGVRQSDGSFRFDFRHELRFGGIPEPRRGEKRDQRRIGKIQLLGEPYFPGPIVRGKFQVEPGDRYDFFEIRKGLDRLNKMYARERLLEAGIRMRRNPANGKVDLSLTIKPGPQVTFSFEGASVPGRVERRVREAWHAGIFDTQRAESALDILNTWLVGDGYLRPQITYTVSWPAADRKRVLFDIQMGARYGDVELAFEGASGIGGDALRSLVKKQDLTTAVYTSPRRVTELIERFYQEMGYLDAAVSAPRYELNPASRTGKVVFPVKEGPLFTIGRLAFSGNTVFSAEKLAQLAPLPPGTPYRPVLRDTALNRLRDAYGDAGYNDFEATFAAARRPGEGVVDVTVRIAEGARGVVREVLLEGNFKTSDRLIRSQLELRPGDPLSLRKLGESRRNLYNTGAYAMVDIAREPIDETTAGPDRPIRLRVKVREVQPFELRYGGLYDTERGPGVIADFSNRNSLGNARVLGLRTRYDSQLKEARLYFSQPNLRRLPLKTIVTPYLSRESNPATVDTDGFNVDRVGFSVQQEAAFRGRTYIVNYGYRFDRSRTYDTGAEALFDVPLRVGSLTTTFSRETRDEVLDATRGSFFSQALQYAPPLLGSDLRFLKYFGQYFKYIPLRQPRLELFTNQLVRPRLVYATAVRVGLARGFDDQVLPLSERFLAGGATTIRGFQQNSVGPNAGPMLPLGGQAMLVFNNELRFPLFWRLDGVGFLDAGNVYSRAGDLSLRDLREAAGLGLRLRTPWFLLRLDYGFKLDRRPGESAGRLFFSIGQAF